MTVGDDALVAALASSQRLGLIGGAPIGDTIEHAGAFVDALRDVVGTVVDLGSGGGVPGLVIARARPDLRLVLIDRRSSCTDHLHRLVRRLSLHDRVVVVTSEADLLSRELDRAEAVVARGFASPQVTAAAAAPLLLDGGRLVVSAPPPGPPDPWTDELLATNGLRRLVSEDRRVVVSERVPRGTSSPSSRQDPRGT